jgi:hypothetical protein
MPIKPDALPTPEPDETPQPAPEATEPAKTGRRTKKQMIADAVIPAPLDRVEVKDTGTGVKVMRSWVEAVSSVASGTAEFTNRAHHYAMLKAAEEGQAPPAPETPADPEPSPAAETPDLGRHSGKPLETNAPDGHRLAPENAELGDEVIVGSETYFVGHGNRLVQGIVSNGSGDPVQARHRWQRELGSGEDGPWQSTPLAQTPLEAPPATVEREQLPTTFEPISTGSIRVGTGILDKIGLPSRGGEWSSLQIGPITSSREVDDDGRRTVITLNGKEQSVPTAALEAFHEVAALVEYMGNYMRGELASFLETQGVVLTPLVPA